MPQAVVPEHSRPLLEALSGLETHVEEIGRRIRRHRRALEAS